MGHHNEIHVLHRNSPQDHFISHDDSSNESDAILEPGFDGANVGHHTPGAVGQRDFLLPLLSEGELKTGVIWNDQVDRSGINQCVGLDWVDVCPSWISQRQHGGNESHRQTIAQPEDPCKAVSLVSQRHRPAAPGGGATGASLASVASAEEVAAGVPLTGIRGGGLASSILFRYTFMHN